MLPLLFSVVLADNPAWWSEDAVSRGSALFGKAQARDAEAFEKAQDQLEAAKRAVGDLELGVAVIGGGAAMERYAESLDRQLAGQFLRLQKHADLLGSDYAKVFGDALEAAIAKVAPGATECRVTSKVEMLMGKAPKCPGDDVSARLAAAMDANPALEGAIAEILTIQWPTIEVKGEVSTPIALTGLERSVDAATLTRKLQHDALAALDDERDIAIEQLSDDMESSDPKVQAAAVEKAAQVRAAWKAAVAKLGPKVKADATKILTKAAKKGGPAGVALCANPASLGGCGVPDVTREFVALVSD